MSNARSNRKNGREEKLGAGRVVRRNLMKQRMDKERPRMEREFRCGDGARVGERQRR